MATDPGAVSVETDDRGRLLMVTWTDDSTAVVELLVDPDKHSED